MKKFFNKFVGTKAFYSRVLFIALPIIIQNVVSNFVNLLDNLMVGQVGTTAMSGVAIINQLVFVFNLGVFGYQSGAGILGTQFYGKQDKRGVGDTFRFKLIFGVIFVAITYLIYRFWGDDLIMLYIHEGESGIDINEVFQNAHDYIAVIMWGLPFFMLSQCYATSLRETQETRIPMIASVSAVLVNLCFNWILIFGKLGAPAMGAVGAAIATVMSRIVECAIIIIWSHTHKEKAIFAEEIFTHFGIEKKTLKLLVGFTTPAFINEILWSGGQTILNQCFSLRGVEIVSATNISSTVNLLGKCVFLSIGVTIGIMIGNALGAHDEEQAVDIDTKLIALSFTSAVIVAVLLCIASGSIPNLYNTEELVKNYASKFIIISACLMPMDAIVNGEYHTIKSGSKPIVTFLFDAGFTWIVMVPTAFVLSHYTNINIYYLYTISYSTQVIKLIIGTILVRKKVWVRNLVDN